MKTKLIAVLLSALMLVSVFTGCVAHNDPPEKEKPTKTPEQQTMAPDVRSESYQETITWVPQYDFKSFDTQNECDGTEHSIYFMVFNCLIERSFSENGKLVPGLAESWSWISDTILELKLRKGVQFHNGTGFTADDVLFTLKRAKEQGGTKAKVALIDRVEALDPYTVRIVLSKCNTDFLLILTDPRLSILSKGAFDTLPAAEANTIGTGPFKYVDFVPHDHVTLERNEKYWGELAKTKKFVLREIPEQTARLFALQNGEVDIISQPATTDLHYIAEDDSLKLLTFPGMTLRHLALNTMIAPTNDIKVRQAIAYGINRDEFNTITYSGNGIVVNNIMHINNEFYKKVDAIEYDPQKAKQILADAGYKAGDITLELLGLTNADDLDFAVVFQGQMKEIGINVIITQEDYAAYNIDCAPGNTKFHVFIDGWGGFLLGPDYALRTLFGSQGTYNECNVKDEFLDNLLDQAVTLKDQAERREIYNQIQDYICEQVFDIPMIIETINCATRVGVEGIEPPQGTQYYLRNVCKPIS